MQRPLSRLVQVPEISEQGDSLPAMLLPLQSLGDSPSTPALSQAAEGGWQGSCTDGLPPGMRVV